MDAQEANHMIYAWIYRKVMRILHHFDLHYAPEIGPFEDGRTQLWCKWCGFRMSKVRRSVGEALGETVPEGK